MPRKPAEFLAITVLAGTKVALDQHIQSKYKDLYKLKAENNLSGCDVAVPCKQNSIIVIDIDVKTETHKVDGREWWADWLKENGGEDTYIVRTLSGGLHYYYSLPPHVDEETFHPKKSLAPGVDIKWKGYVVAPPTPGYEPVNNTTLHNIKPMSSKLLRAVESSFHKPYEGVGGIDITNFRIHTPIPVSGIPRLKGMLSEFGLNNPVSYDDWIKGIFSITAAIDDVEERNNCIELWTRNQSYQDGDIEKAIEISRRSDPMGETGPGTIFELIKQNKKLVEVKSNTLPTIEQLLADDGLQTIQKKAGILVILPIESNVCTILENIFPNTETDLNHPEIHKSMFFDHRKRVPYLKGKQLSQGVDYLAYKILGIIQGHYRLAHFKFGVIKNGLELFLSRRYVDPCAEEIKGLTWDGHKRMHKFFTSFFPAEGEQEYLRRCGDFFWRSYVYRILEPGIKCDEIITLIGAEGTRKTSIVGAVGGEYTYYCGEENAFVSRDCLLNMHRSTIVELEEMTAFKNSDPNTIKGYLSRTTDTVRQMFGRNSYDAPRSFIMIGTTNNRRFLTESMGIRRFLPIVLGGSNKIDVELFLKYREQLLAEGKHYYDENVPLRLDVSAFQKELVSKHQFRSPQAHLHEEVREFIRHKSVVDVRQIYNHLHISYPSNTNRQTEKHYRAIFRTLDTEEFVDMGDGKTYRKKEFLSDIL